MAGLLDNIKQTFADAKERRQNTSFGERLSEGLNRGFGVGQQSKRDQAYTEETGELPTAWGSVLDSIRDKAETPGILPGEFERSGGMSKTGSADGAYIKQGLIERGLPEHVAEAFVWNMQDESGLDPGINEIEPLVEGSRGGYGLYQLTGPRRKAYEKVAQHRGVDFNDVDAQLDFLVHELGTTEKRAAGRLSKTSTPEEAAAVIVQDFLRPSKEHMVRRRNKYLQGGMSIPESEPAPLITSWNDLL
jgi:hypothetical protein